MSEFLRAFFEKAENGTLNYEQLMEACKSGNVKLANLAEGGYVSKQKYDDDIKSRDTRITDLTNTISNRDSDLANLQTKLSGAGEDRQKLETLTNDLTALQSKYDADTKAYKDQLEKQAYEFAVSTFANSQKFSSSAAKRDFINSMKEKNLKVDDNGTILGATDFMQSYRSENADAFIVEEKPNLKPQPSFVAPTPGLSSQSGETEFNFGFVGVRPRKAD